MAVVTLAPHLRGEFHDLSPFEHAEGIPDGLSVEPEKPHTPLIAEHHRPATHPAGLKSEEREGSIGYLWEWRMKKDREMGGVSTGAGR